jgi:AcrR family transcriptional regulator
VPTVFARGVARSLAPKQEALIGEVNQIIAATYRLISRTDTIDPSPRAILREAGLSTPVFYRYFRGENELFVGLLEQFSMIVATNLREQMIAATESAGRIEVWMRGILAQAADPDAARRSRLLVAAVLIFYLTNAALTRHVLNGTAPTEDETAHLVRFVLKAVGTTPSTKGATT